MHKDEAIEKFIAICIMCIFLVPLSIPAYENSPFYDSNAIVCSSVTGEIIDKEPFYIIVRVEDNYTYINEDFKVYVSLKAYNNYTIGDTHIEPICTLSDYSLYKDLIESLKQSGILE
tara:strand:+ start:69 stop:419 length:351 start_codon:yes stop_codon:yes gene_type:complete